MSDHFFSWPSGSALLIGMEAEVMLIMEVGAATELGMSETCQGINWWWVDQEDQYSAFHLMLIKSKSNSKEPLLV